MQKVINVLAVVSFGISGALAAGLATAYVQREAIKTHVQGQVGALIGDAVGSAVGDLPSLLDGGGAPSPGGGVPGGMLPF
jgi:hypothetical protein